MGNLKDENDIILKSFGYHLRLIRQEKQLLKCVRWIVEVTLILKMENAILPS